MEQIKLTDDPYGDFPWHSSLTVEPTEPVDLRGLIPCEFGCEAGWLPLLDGTMVGCPGCHAD